MIYRHPHKAHRKKKAQHWAQQELSAWWRFPNAKITQMKKSRQWRDVTALVLGRSTFSHSINYSFLARSYSDVLLTMQKMLIITSMQTVIPGRCHLLVRPRKKKKKKVADEPACKLNCFSTSDLVCWVNRQWRRIYSAANRVFTLQAEAGEGKGRIKNSNQ